MHGYSTSLPASLLRSLKICMGDASRPAAASCGGMLTSSGWRGAADRRSFGFDGPICASIHTMQALSSPCVAGFQCRNMASTMRSRQHPGAAPFTTPRPRCPELTTQSSSRSWLPRAAACPAPRRRSLPTQALKQVERCAACTAAEQMLVAGQPAFAGIECCFCGAGPSRHAQRRKGCCTPPRCMAPTPPPPAFLVGRYTQDSVAAVKKAQSEASKLGKNFVGPEHLLLGMLAVGAEDKGEHYVIFIMIKSILCAVETGASRPATRRWSRLHGDCAAVCIFERAVPWWVLTNVGAGLPAVSGPAAALRGSLCAPGRRPRREEVGRRLWPAGSGPAGRGSCLGA